MVQLVLLGMLAAIGLFAIINTMASGLSGIFTALMIILGYMLIAMTYYKRNKMSKAKYTIKKGNEEIIYYASMIVFASAAFVIYMGHVKVDSIMSPVVVVSWLLPLISYLKHESIVYFFQKELIYQGEHIPCNSIKTIHVENKKNKRKLTLSGKGKTYVFTGTVDYINQIEQVVRKYCHKVK